MATLRRLAFGTAGGRAPQTIDRVIATLFAAPASYTGDDVLEISAHGSPVVLDAIVEAAVSAGARLAKPGEFTLRAYLNGKLDLVQAEAVADLIAAVTPSQARVAFDQLEGSLSGALAEVEKQLFDLRVRLEASLDFPEEGYHFIDPGTVAAEARALEARVADLLAGSRLGRLIREGRTVAIVGAPNVGKSLLFNRLVGADRAIVTPIAGTTRDLLTEKASFGGIPITLVDTAGLRETSETVEREGIARARSAAAASAACVVVLDRSAPLDQQSLDAFREANGSMVVAANKCDLPAAWDVAALRDRETMPVVAVSALTGEGIDRLRDVIFQTVTQEEYLRDTPHVSNIRHIKALEEVQAGLRSLATAAEAGEPEEVLLAALQEASYDIDGILGRRSADDVLREVFSRFCIGK